MLNRTHVAVVVLLGLLALGGCSGIDEAVGTSTDGVRQFADRANGTVCYYQSNALSQYTTAGSLSCVRTDTVPDSYPALGDREEFRVVPRPEAGVHCYEWQRFDYPVSCVRTGTQSSASP